MRYLLALIALVFATPVYAALHEGAKAPNFTAQASLGGNEFTFTLADALKDGPVVLYFYPAAFTQGCTIEAHEFAEATDEFKALGATVIGISADDIATLKKFSVSECRSKFAVAAGSKDVIKAYDAVLLIKPDRSDRTSYVIAPDGTILMSYSALSPVEHVKRSMAAVKAWRATHPK